ncbi:MAG: SNF2-related protein [Cellulosilyticaceae bacterium]
MLTIFNQKEYASEQEKLFYAVLYRRFADVVGIIDRNSFKFKYVQDFTVKNITLKEIIAWNIDYLDQYDKRSGLSTHLTKWIEPLVYDDINNKFTYDEIIQDGKSIFDIFFKCQPLLGVEEIQGQDLPSKQVHKNNMSLVLDEVGSGKSVSALYSIANIIDDANANERSAHILIVAPSPLKEKWHHDIRRQLGRYSHIVSRGDLDEQYEDNCKSIYFKDKEQCIFIIDNIDIAKKTNMQKWAKYNNNNKESWDLVIIDECHLCTSNYKDIRAKNIMLLTATPIVIASQKKHINFDTYKNLMETIIQKSISKIIDPIKNRNPKDTDIFVNRFREDFYKIPCNRLISFKNCIRNKDWYQYYSTIAAEKGTLTALHYAQDDDYLVSEYNKLENQNIYSNYNGKLIMLKYIIGLDLTVDEQNYIQNGKDYTQATCKKSYIIFCEHQEVINNIYDYLKNTSQNLVVAKKYSDTEIFDEGKCEDGTLISQLYQSIKIGKQTILITTGQTGGTGLNLGNFDGVIHYELPFTSIQLEQRYGRVDRMDTSISKDKEMIFLLNECDKKDYFNYNSMLYYCVSKIDATCRYLPIRNTVLFYPEVTKQIIDNIVDTLKNLEKEEIFQSPVAMNDLNSSEKKYKADISDTLGKKLLSKEEIKRLVDGMDDIPNPDIREKVEKYAELLKSKMKNNKVLEQYKQIKSVAENILKILFNIQIIAENDDVFILQDVEALEVEDERFVVKNEENIIKDISQNEEKNWMDDIKILIDKLQKVNSTSYNGEGIFYCVDYLYKRSVKDFRNYI